MVRCGRARRKSKCISVLYHRVGSVALSSIGVLFAKIYCSIETHKQCSPTRLPLTWQGNHATEWHIAEAWAPRSSLRVGQGAPHPPPPRQQYAFYVVETTTLTYGPDVSTLCAHLASLELNLRGHQLKLYKKSCRLNIRKYFFSQRTVSSWNSLPNHVVAALSVNSFKKRLDDHMADMDNS